MKNIKHIGVVLESNICGKNIMGKHWKDSRDAYWETDILNRNFFQGMRYLPDT